MGKRLTVQMQVCLLLFTPRTKVKDREEEKGKESGYKLLGWEGNVERGWGKEER